jgi:flagellin
MTSILTNTGAMTALQTLRTINKDLAQTQNQISTGKSISSAKDNSAIWAISKVMESDVAGFKAIKSSLALGESSVAVARNASESITNLLTDIKSKIVAAQEENVDREKIQTDIGRLRDQITNIVSGSQFNGLNLLNNREVGADTAAIVANVGSGSVNFLSSLDRASDGTVTSASITARKTDLSAAEAAQGAGTDLATSAVSGLGAIANNASGTITIAGDTATAARGGNAVLAGDSYELGGFTGLDDIRYVARDGDTVADIARGLAERINFRAAEAGVNIRASVKGAELTVTNNSGADITTTATLNSGGTASGGLELLGLVDVSTRDGARAALSAIEGLIQTGTSAAATMGSAQRRIEIQSDFVSKLTDSLLTGIGSLVDADLEEASARLQALQVQQQLGIQSLSIANQAPQSILALFR